METKNISNMSQKETKIRKTTIIFGSIVIVLTYVWAILSVCYFTAGQTIHLDALIYVQMFIYLFVLATFGLLVTIAVYDGKRMKSSSKESIIIFAMSTIIAIVVLVFSAMQLPGYISFICHQYDDIANPKWMFIILAALLLAISCNFVFVRNTKLTEKQKLLKPISNCLAVLLGLAVIPFVFGIAQYWLGGGWRDAFDESILHLESTIFQLMCILLIVKLITVCFDKQAKQIVLWSILIGIALITTIWVISYNASHFWFSTKDQNVYFLIASSSYMMSMPITYLCLNKKEKQINRRKYE